MTPEPPTEPDPETGGFSDTVIEQRCFCGRVLENDGWCAAHGKATTLACKKPTLWGACGRDIGHHGPCLPIPPR